VCGDRGAYAAGRKSDYGTKRATPKEPLWPRQSHRKMVKGASDSLLEAVLDMWPSKKCGVEGQKGRIHWGFRISYTTFYFDHEPCLRPGLLETGPVCLNPYSIILECFRAMPTVRWLRSGTPF
jgi:hypothetical protein